MNVVLPTPVRVLSTNAPPPEIGVLQSDQTGQELLEQALRVLDPSVVRLYQGLATPDLGGQSSTSDFTDEVIRRVSAKLEVWTTLG